MEMQNANPTILNISDLPTRKPAPSARPRSCLTSLVPRYAVDPFTSPSHSDEDGQDDDQEEGEDDGIVDRIDAQEIYDLVSTMCDPEHPITLGELAVVNLEHITVRADDDDDDNDGGGGGGGGGGDSDDGGRGRPRTTTVSLEFTPTITHCHLATVIGLGLVVRLQQALPPRFRISVRCREGTHTTDRQLNKQLADKERVLSALENETLMGLVAKMIETCK